MALYISKQKKSLLDDHPPSMRFLLNIAKKIEIGSLTISFSKTGEEYTYYGTQKGPHGDMIIHDEAVAKRLITGGMLGFNESYDDGLWDSPDLDALFKTVLINEQAIDNPLLGSRWYRILNFIIHRLRPNSKRGSKKNISAHYDLGNDFYQKWLDQSMTYSSAVFGKGIKTLHDAQQNKYKKLAEKLDLKPEHTVLEIGCGWGGFAEYVARDIGASIHAITISQEQYDFAKARIEKAGLADKAKIELIDYRDITGHYDRIASIEMFEAVGEKYWPIYFQTIKDRLKKGGRAALQIITIEDHRFDFYRRNPDYIQKYIFPGGMLPSLTVLKDQVHKAGLLWHDFESYAKDYAKTLRLWNDSFQKQWPDIKPLGFDNRFKRMWEQYFAYCSSGFDCGNIDVIQCALIKK